MPLNPASPLAALLDAPMRPGLVRWIGLRPARGAAMQEPEQAEAIGGRGLAGDRFRAGASGARQVTLIEAESLAAIASYLGLPQVHPAQVRRNILVSGVNLLSLKGKRFRLGGALLEWSGECHPCSRMEAALGPGGYNALRGHGGATARVIESGEICLGDAVTRD